MLISADLDDLTMLIFDFIMPLTCMLFVEFEGIYVPSPPKLDVIM